MSSRTNPLHRRADTCADCAEADAIALAQANAALAAAILRREELERALREKEEALLDAERRKDELLSMLAHELRNPLAPILTAAEMIRQTTRGDRGVERFRSVIERQVKNLARLVDDLLDASRITRGSITLQKKKVELGSVVLAAIDATRPLVDAARHDLVVELPEATLYVTGDPTRLEQVFVNLLNNASKYTSPGGRIEVVIEHDGRTATARVRDNGIGMPEDLLPRVFDLFVQGHRTLDRSQGGLGIGLTLVKNLVVMHDGAVEARSGGVGKGCEILVKLPLSEVVPLAPRAEPTADDREEARRTKRARRALVVEDNADAAYMLSELLGCWGYDVRAVPNGEEGVEVARSFVPHIVLLDIGLPGMDGFEVAKRLRSSRAAGAVSPLVLIGVSGSAFDEGSRAAREAGFDHHLLKPLDPAKLRDALTALTAAVDPMGLSA